MNILGINKANSNSVKKKRGSPLVRDNSPHKRITAEEFKLSKYLKP